MCDFFIFSGVMLSLALAIGLPVYGVVLFQRWQRNRAESERIGKIKEGKEHPHYTKYLSLEWMLYLQYMSSTY